MRSATATGQQSADSREGVGQCVGCTTAVRSELKGVCQDELGEDEDEGGDGEVLPGAVEPVEQDDASAVLSCNVLASCLDLKWLMGNIR